MTTKLSKSRQFLHEWSKTQIAPCSSELPTPQQRSNARAVSHPFLGLAFTPVSLLLAAANLFLFLPVCSKKPADVLHGTALAKSCPSWQNHTLLGILRSSSLRLCAPAPVARVCAAVPPACTFCLGEAQPSSYTSLVLLGFSLHC